MEGKRCEASPQAAPNMLIKREVDSQYNVGLNPAILVGTATLRPGQKEMHLWSLS